MANEIGTSQLTGSIPDIVRATALKARFDAVVVANQVYNTSADVQNFGDRVSLSILPAFALNAVGTGGTVTRQQLSLTAVEVVVDTWKEATVDVEDRAEIQSSLNTLRDFSSQFGELLALSQDTDLCGQHSNITTYTVGDTTNPTPLDDSMVRLARLKLDKNSSGANGTGNIPKKGRFWVLSPDGEADLLSQARFSEAQNTGFAKGLQVEGGRISMLYGDPVFVTDQVTISGSIRKNLYLGAECLAIATQRNFKLVDLAKVQLSTAICGHILYGTKTIRADHGVVVNSAVNADA